MSVVAPSDGGIEPVPEPTIDHTVLDELRLIGEPDGQEFLAELIGDFTHDIERLLPELRDALSGGDTRAVGQVAHSMKGSAGQLGGQRFAAACARLEVRATGRSPSLEPGVLQELEALYQELLAALSGQLSPAG